MRVSSGLLKGKILTSPQDSAVRPTSDKVRAALMSSLGSALEGAMFLDIFAGTGAVGIEAYSRGARFVTFVESLPAVLKVNLNLLPAGSYSLIPQDLFKSRISGLYDIIFIDPPYGKYKPEQVLNFIHKQGLLAGNGVIAYEESSRTDMDIEDGPFSIVRKRRYGDSTITYLESI